MAGRVHEKLSCPFCPWVKRNILLPAHLLDAHIEEIHRYPTNAGQCLSGYVGNKPDRIEFCVCFTCKKGFVGHGRNPKHEQWLTMHAAKDICATAYQQRLAEFKTKCAHDTTPTTVKTGASPTIHTDVMAIWERCRADNNCRPAIEEIETWCKEMEEEFSYADGIIQLALNVESYKKSVTKVERKMEKMNKEHDAELTEHRVVMAQQQQNIRDLHSSVRQLNYEQSESAREMKALKARIALLEKQIAEIVPKCSEQNPSPYQV